MKIVAISDIHGQLPGTEDIFGPLPEIPECDILVISGDICPVHNHNIEFQASWVSEVFSEWVVAQPAQDVVWIAGNHDFVFQHGKNLIKRWEGIYLEDDGIELQGLKIWGTPWQPWFWNWAFNAPNDGDRGESFLNEKWQLWDEDIDVLLVHGPPHMCLDLVPRGERTGSRTLRNRIEYTNQVGDKPELVVCGHIHCSRGVDKIEETTVVNAAVINEAYEMVHKPIIIEMEDGKVKNVDIQDREMEKK